MNPASPVEIVSAHSPDSDDAFMFYVLATKKVRSSKVVFKHVLSDIETLNRKAMEGVYELSAISYHAYPYVADKYVLMASGSSIGDGYGPMIIANRPMEPEELKGKRIAIPGKMTTAFLACKLFQPDFEPVVTPFDKIMDAVRERSVDCGLIIHEGQLSFEREGFHRVVDLGRWFKGVYGLPLPLGGNVLLRSLDAIRNGGVASTGCIGNRIYTEIGDDELYISLRGSTIDRVAAELDTIQSANQTLLTYHQERKAQLTS